jgi:hypothetical protein
MLPFGVTIPATVPQGSEIPEGLMNNPVLLGFLVYLTGRIGERPPLEHCIDTNITQHLHFDVLNLSE